MALDESILDNVKKNCGLDGDYDAFDVDVITQINTCFFSLNQLGIGPEGGFEIENKDTKWSEFVDPDINVSARNALKTYFYLKVRMFFDPPSTGYHLTAMKEQIEELEHRLLTERELVKWQAPSSSPSLP